MVGFVDTSFPMKVNYETLKMMDFNNDKIDNSLLTDEEEQEISEKLDII